MKIADAVAGMLGPPRKERPRRKVKVRNETTRRTRRARDRFIWTDGQGGYDRNGKPLPYVRAKHGPLGMAS